MLAAGALSFPTLAAEREFAIVSPAAGSTLRAEATADVSLTYVLRGYSADRLCLDLRRGAPRAGAIYAPAARPYANGCFAPGQPITLQRLPHGDYELDASLRAGPADARLANATRVHFAVAPEASADEAPAFEPSYEWQQVLPQQGVPAGLEVHLSVDGSGDRRARIPDPWRLQLYLGRARGFLRLDVGRRTRVREVEAAAAQAASSHVRHAAAAVRVCGARLLDGGAALDPEQTAEEAALFSRRGRLEARLEACDGGHVDVEAEDRRAATASSAAEAVPPAAEAAERAAQPVFLLAPPA
jgi:hypothetical protein